MVRKELYYFGYFLIFSGMVIFFVAGEVRVRFLGWLITLAGAFLHGYLTLLWFKDRNQHKTGSNVFAELMPPAVRKKPYYFGYSLICLGVLIYFVSDEVMVVLFGWLITLAGAFLHEYLTRLWLKDRYQKKIGSSVSARFTALNYFSYFLIFSGMFIYFVSDEAVVLSFGWLITFAGVFLQGYLTLLWFSDRNQNK